MCGRSRMNDQRLYIANIGQQAEQLHRVDECLSCLVPALDTEREQRSRTFRQILLRELVIRTGRQPGIVHPLDRGMLAQMLGNSQRVFGMLLQAQVQRLNSLEKEE